MAPAAVDTTVTSLNDRNVTLQNTMNAFRQSSGETLLGEGGATRRLKRSLDTGVAASSDFFRRRSPDNHYLAAEEYPVWSRYLDYHAIASEQYTHQYEKMVAAMRLAGYRSDAAGSRTREFRVREAAVATLRGTDTTLLENFRKLVDQLASGDFSQTILDLLTVSLEVLYTTLETLLEEDRVRGLAYAVLTYLAVDKLLEIVKIKSLENLDFQGNDNIVVSLGKMALAALALMGLMSLERLGGGSSPSARVLRAGEAPSQDGDEEIRAFLESLVLQGKLVMVLMNVLNRVVGEFAEDTRKKVENLTAKLQNADGYTLDEDDLALIERLKSRARIMAVFGLVMKGLFHLLASGPFSDELERTAFDTNGDADRYAFLFGSQINPYDEAFNTYLHDLIAEIEGGGGEGSGATAIFELLDALSTRAYNFAIETERNAFDFTTQIESDAYGFASLMARLSYRFADATESDAYAFATHMADLAYAFTMKIEDDAYHFALQGMEWGYLFASRGEEVGIMADRVLWMAVQIGQMADRIGEMADRIVYTEQLIVYTEMLILDFGLLIYGGMKTIANMVLTGLALILDRRWYRPETEDLLIETIGANVETMLENMQEYALSVLENQNRLRETTQDALEWILEMERLQQQNSETPA
ncbi:hypothetical protein [Hydrogenimonas sp.]